MTRPQPISTLFPYTTLFRSGLAVERDHDPGLRADPDPRDPVRRRHDRARGLQHERRDRSDRADRKSTRLNSSHMSISYAVFCLKKKNEDCKEKRKDVVARAD